MKLRPHFMNGSSNNIVINLAMLVRVKLLIFGNYHKIYKMQNILMNCKPPISSIQNYLNCDIYQKMTTTHPIVEFTWDDNYHLKF